MEQKNEQKSKEEIIAQLSKLSLLEISETQHDSLMNDLASILKYVQRLQKIDTEGVIPTHHGTIEEMVIRPDAIQRSSHAKALISNVPEQNEGQIKVKGVFGNGA